MPKHDPKHIVLAALRSWEGDRDPVDLEDLAMDCWRADPERFGMANYHHPRVDATYYVLKHLKADGAVSGGNKHGWRLTAAGIACLAASPLADADPLDIAHIPARG